MATKKNTKQKATARKPVAVARPEVRVIEPPRADAHDGIEARMAAGMDFKEEDAIWETAASLANEIEAALDNLPTAWNSGDPELAYTDRVVLVRNADYGYGVSQVFGVGDLFEELTLWCIDALLRTADEKERLRLVKRKPPKGMGAIEIQPLPPWGGVRLSCRNVEKSFTELLILAKDAGDGETERELDVEAAAPAKKPRKAAKPKAAKGGKK